MAKSVKKSARTMPRKTARAATHGTVNIHAHLRTPLKNLRKFSEPHPGSRAI